MYSNGLLHMNVAVMVDQKGLTYISYVQTLDRPGAMDDGMCVCMCVCVCVCEIERERDSEDSILSAWLDNDIDDYENYYFWERHESSFPYSIFCH